MMQRYRPEVIKARQSQLRWSNEVLAAKAGVSEQTVNSARFGRSLTTDNLSYLAAALGIQMWELYMTPLQSFDTQRSFERAA